MSKNSDLTIILTLKDRISFTYRWMDYMNALKCPYKILIADGGEDKSIEENLKNSSNYPSLDYNYIRYPYDAKIEDYYLKFENVISLVKTKYMLLADNDDFYLLDHMEQMLAFLDTHDDFVGCRGQFANLSLFSKSGKVNGINRGDRYLAIANEVHSIESESPYDRVDILCRDTSYDYYINWYCIYRSKQFQEVWNFLITLPIKEVMVTEELTLIFMVYRGKIKIFNDLFYIRQSNTSMSGATLIVGNEFLERCIINNALSDFRLAVDKYLVYENKEQKECIMKAIAAWLEITIIKIYLGRHRRNRSQIFRLKEKIKPFTLFSPYLLRVYYWITNRFFKIRKRWLVDLKVIEPFILK